MPKPPFPTHHPLVRNPDGSRSNVVTMSASMDGRHYVIPTMVGGKRLGPDQAIRVARLVGLNAYPSYATEEKATQASERLHDRQPATGGIRLNDRRLREALR